MTETTNKTATPGIEVSPRGIAAYAWLYKKDVKFAKGDPDKAKHKLTLVVDKDAPGIPEFTASIQEHHVRNGGKEDEGPVTDGDKSKDKDGKLREEFAGKWKILFSTQYQPAMVDSKKTPLPDGVKIFSGDEVRIAFKRIDYDGFGGGVSLRMNAVQLLVKNAGGGADAFGDDDEGYVVPEDRREATEWAADAQRGTGMSAHGESNRGDY